MTRHWIAIALALASFVTFVPAPVAAQSLKVVATLDGGEVVPNKVNTGAHGIVEITGDAPTGLISWKVKLANLPTGILGVTVRVGGAGIAGPEMFSLDSPLFWSNEVEFTGSKLFTAVTLQPALGIRDAFDMVQTLFGGVSAHVVVHTQLNPNGEIRGQLRRVP